MISLATRLERAGFRDGNEREPDAWPEERRAILAELRRRIESMERRPAPSAPGVRLPPAAPPSAGARQRCLAELDGAETAEWGVRFVARARPKFFGDVGAAARAAPAWLGRLAGKAAPLAEGLDGVRIVDCETTGLAGGTGTLAFLVGVGAFAAGSELVVEQLLVRGPAAEPKFLDDLLAVVGAGATLVTFNGRAFDGPLLRTRCILARRRPEPFVALPHVDLLPLARRMWRARAGDCRLVTLEENVLRRRRAEDTPGFLAPAAYAEFLRGGDPAALSAIVGHNREDIIGTAGLLLAMLRILDDPLRFAEDAAELRAAAVQRAVFDGAERAVPLYARALEVARTPAIRRKLLGEVACVLRRLQKWELAAETWAGYAREFPTENRGFVELAKIVERRRKDVAGALTVLGRAPHPACVDVERRRTRLERRLRRQRAP